MTSGTSLLVTGRARGHIRRAAEWWELNRPLAPGAVHEELDEAFALLRSQPRIGLLATNTKTGGVRRLHLQRIHHFLYYRLRRHVMLLVGRRAARELKHLAGSLPRFVSPDPRLSSAARSGGVAGIQLVSRRSSCPRPFANHQPQDTDIKRAKEYWLDWKRRNT